MWTHFGKKLLHNKNAIQESHKDRHKWFNGEQYYEDGSRIPQPTRMFNRLNLTHFKYVQEILRITKNFVNQHGPYDIKMNNNDKVESKFTAHCLELLKEKKQEDLREENGTELDRETT